METMYNSGAVPMMVAILVIGAIFGLVGVHLAFQASFNVA